MTALKSCPFCGNPPGNPPGRSINSCDGAYWIECGECGSHGPRVFTSGRAAAEEWDTRPDPYAQTPESLTTADYCVGVVAKICENENEGYINTCQICAQLFTAHQREGICRHCINEGLKLVRGCHGL